MQINKSRNQSQCESVFPGELSDEASTLEGKLLHSLGAVSKNAPSPLMFSLDLGTSRSSWFGDLRVDRNKAALCL